jgi:hypothetical protein
LKTWAIQVRFLQSLQFEHVPDVEVSEAVQIVKADGTEP